MFLLAIDSKPIACSSDSVAVAVLCQERLEFDGSADSDERTYQIYRALESTLAASCIPNTVHLTLAPFGAALPKLQIPA